MQQWQQWQQWAAAGGRSRTFFGDCNGIGVAPIAPAEPVQGFARQENRSAGGSRFATDFSTALNLCDDWQPPRYREAKEDVLLYFTSLLLPIFSGACAHHSPFFMAIQMITLDPGPSMSSPPLDSKDRQRHQDVADKPF